MEGDLGLQEDELTALEAIYGDDAVVSRAERCVEVHIPSISAQPKVVFKALLPVDYPSSSAPVFMLTAPHVSDDALMNAVSSMEDTFMPGEGMLYNSVEWLRGQADLWHSAKHLDDESDSDFGEGVEEVATVQVPVRQMQQWSDEETAEMIAMAPLIVSCEPLTERKSTFQAHVAPVTRSAQVKAVRGVLLQNNKIRNATHNMMAYRIHVPDKGTFLQDCDDDGEAAAGSRLLHLLQVADARNVVVVVSRWFGGVLLGPSRFTLINNTARAALESLGYIGSGGNGSGSVAVGSGSKSNGKKGKR